MTPLYFIDRLPANSPLVCTCNNPMVSDINITFTSTSLTITQTGHISNLMMLNILRHHLLFVHSTDRQIATYTAVISVVASDGTFSSVPVYSIVTVNSVNEIPVADVRYIDRLIDR